MLMNIPQPAPTLRATIQPGFFRLIDLPVHRLLSPGKLPLPGFPSRPLWVLHQFPPRKWRRLALPRSLQFFHVRLQALQKFLQSQIVDLQSLNVGSLPHQFQLQFSDPLVFRTGLGILLPLVAHPRKFTIFDSSLPESFGLRFSEV
jgi:hypothetical protein